VDKIAQPAALTAFMLPSGVAMELRRTISRNREIFSRFKAGTNVESLAEQYGLTAQRIRALLIDERHRRNLSPELFYRAKRRAGAEELARLALSGN